MFLSVDLQRLEQLTEFQDREQTVASRLENALVQLYQEAACRQTLNLDIINRQLCFVREEQRRIRGRKALLLDAHNTISGAKFSFVEKLTDAKQKLYD